MIEPPLRLAKRAYRRVKRAALTPRFSSAAAERAARQFHQVFYGKGLHGQTWYRGVRLIKCPLDLWIVRELVERIRPDAIIETGTYLGGSALYYGDLLDAIDHGLVVTIDQHPLAYHAASTETVTAPPWRHPRVRYLIGSSVAPAILRQVRVLVPAEARTMVFLDSDHSKAHVLAELMAYAPFVSSGSYLVVEDTNINGHPVKADFGPGPMEAVRAFLALEDGREFAPDAACERYLLTMNPGGWLKRGG